MTRFIDEDDENYILKDGESRSCRLMMKDSITPNPALSSVQRAIAASHGDATTFDASTFDAASHRPGHRYSNDTAAAATRDAMYADADRKLSDAWKTKAPPPSGAYPEGTSHAGGACTVDGAQQTMDAVYSEYDLRIQNSWRTAS
jgi:hypothetical protein